MKLLAGIIKPGCPATPISPAAVREDAMKLRISRLLAIAAFVAACLLGSAQSPAQNAYIASGLSNNVSVIDTATNTVTATIPVGRSPEGVAVTPDSRKVYVANVSSNTYGGLNGATAALGFASVGALQNAILSFCEG
jgi:YVTN family beta-propeller protein